MAHHKYAGQAAEEAENLTDDQRHQPRQVHPRPLEGDAERKAGEEQDSRLEEKREDVPWANHESSPNNGVRKPALEVPVYC